MLERSDAARARTAARAHAPLALGILLALLLVLAGCGSSDNGVSSKSADEILVASKAAATSASSVRVSSKTSQGPLSLSSELAMSSEGGHAKVDFVGVAFEAIRIGDTLYVKGSPAFYKSLTRANATVPQGTWLKGPANTNLRQLASFTDLKTELPRMLSTPGSVTKGASTTVNGQKVIELKETTKLYKGSLFIATTGKPYPVLFLKSGREAGRATFAEWDKGLSLSAPSPTVDISTLKA